MLGLNMAATLAGVAIGTMYDSHEGSANYRARGGDKVPAGIPPEAQADSVDTAYVERIDEHDHDLSCSCGCRGEATILGVVGKEGRYVASTMTCDRYLSRADGR